MSQQLYPANAPVGWVRDGGRTIGRPTKRTRPDIGMKRLFASLWGLNKGARHG